VSEWKSIVRYHPTQMNLLKTRIRNQRLTGTAFTSSEEVVGWLGAVQAQEYMAAKWGVSLRARGLTAASIDAAFDQGEILRTHVMRPTWHFVRPADIRWLLTLTAPRVHAMATYRRRQLGLDADTFRRTRRVLQRVLRHRTYLTRAEIGAAFARSGLPGAAEPLGHIMLHHELDALVCSGPRRGARFTYALLEDRVPRGRMLTRDESLAELTRRYFQSHGPATPRDFAWWSGLSMTDVRAGVAMVKPSLEDLVVEDQRYLRLEPDGARSGRVRTRADSGALLLPIYDEYLVAYRDRTAIADPGVDTLGYSLVVDGRIRGTWRKTLTPGSIVLEVSPDGRIDGSTRTAVQREIRRYARFAGVPVEYAQT
jgi:winged helix DNA-binding protein